MSTVKVGFVGTGVIAETHAEAIANNPNVSLEAVADTNLSSAQSFASRWGAKQTFRTLQEMLDTGNVEAIHILTPPDSHAGLAALCIQNGTPVFIEKPAGTSANDLKKLKTAHTANPTTVAVNQNSLFHPAFEQLLNHIESGEIGRPVSIQCHYAAPLRQLESGQFGHWMFAQPINIILEQAVHPLAQILHLAGKPQDVQAITAKPVKIGDGGSLYPTTLINFLGERASAQLHYSVGATYPYWEISVLCSDGVATADLIANRVSLRGRGKWLEASDHAIAGRNLAKQTKRQSNHNFITYAKSMLGLGGRNDAFYLGMAASIANFHETFKSETSARANLDFGIDVIEICLQAGANMKKALPKKEEPREPRETVDVVILGGTGFIGRYVVDKCVQKGLKVRVVARGLANLPAIFSNPLVDLVSADMRDPKAAKSAVAGTKKVINLAHGGGGATREEILSAMLGSAKAVFAACKEARVERLIHIGSIAGLYLGGTRNSITGDTPPDPQPNKRADYGMAKALTDQCLLYLGKSGPQVTILRPGIVVGKGTPAAHSGLGVFNNDQHCLGWSAGTTGLPFVLASDVADAIVLSLEAKDIAGKCYNLCGDVFWTAKEYFAALRRATGRPYQYHAQSPHFITFVENLKVLIKKVAGKKQTFHSIRDFKSRAMYAPFDCSDAKKALNWSPVSDPGIFSAQAIEIHGPTPPKAPAA
jgi:predicted dehydrogenase/nucleoside-diphosphate-sugar epimerase